MSFDEERILESCREVWQAVLGLNLDELGGEGDRSSEGMLASYVKISGAWKGAVRLECPESVSRHACAMLFEVDADALPRQELQDAADELARIVGKNLQQLIAPAGKTSSPRPIEVGEEPTSLAGMRGVLDLDFSCEGRPVRISVMESEAVPAAG
jgi:hypothetical protein